MYMAPEIIKRKKYNEKVDTWALGVISYMLISGMNPYPGRNKQEVKRLIVETEVDMDFESSKKAKDFIKCALNKD